MKPLLIVLNPRRIPECVDAISALRIDKVWLQNYTETDISYVYPRVVEESNHDLIGVLSDDTIPTQDALDAVLAISDPSVVSTGWCPLDDESDLVNLSTEPLAQESPDVPA